jgi:chitin disaccharide deacetylase
MLVQAGRQVSKQTIIVNADDFGMSSATNSAIVEAFQKRLVSTTTIMANMPAFDEAVDLARRFGLLRCVGVHLNITQGLAMTSAIRCCRRFCDETGGFRPRTTTLRLSRNESAAIEMEIEAQVRACLARGLKLPHLDSHHHVHTEWAIGSAVIRVARRYGILAIRLSRNCGPKISVSHRIYKLIYNGRLRLNGLACTEYFGSVTDVQTILGNTHANIEVMVHPRRDANGALVDLDGMDLEKKIRSLDIQDRIGNYESKLREVEGVPRSLRAQL